MKIGYWAIATLGLAFAISQEVLAQSADSIGSAVRVVNKVTAEIDASARDLALGDPVKQNEVIAVAADSLGELRLNDETKLALGPGAKLKLDTFVYDPDKSSGAVTVDLTKGAFRFITGLAKKPSYLIRSPTASITVRGTIFDVYVAADGTMWVLLHEGSIEVCNAQRQCRVLSDPCGMVRVGGGGQLSEAATWNNQPEVREIDFATAFPFVVSPPQVDPMPRFTRVNVEAGQCAADPIPPTPPTRRAEGPAPGPAPATGPASLPATSAPRTQTPDVPPDEPAEPGEPLTPYGPPPVAAMSGDRNWGGFYVGVTAGGTWSKGDTEVVCNDPNGIFDTVFGTPNCRFPIESGALETRYDTGDAGVLGGLTLGYNVQAGNLVAGLEVDVSASSIAGEDKQFKDVPPTSPGERILVQDLEWLSTVRGRLGYASQNWLVFVTGGLAIGRLDYGYSASYSNGVATADLSETKTEVGYTLGAGGEVGFGPFSLKGEYLYFDLGERDLSAQFYVGGSPRPVYFEPEFDNSGHMLRLGVNVPIN